MARRPPSTRAQVVSAVAAAVGVTFTLAGWRKEEPFLLLAGLIVLVALFILLWFVVGRRREKESPLIIDCEGASATHHEPHVSYRRIRVFNSGETTVHNVHVQLSACVQQNATFYPVTLQRMNRAPHPFDLDPDDSAYIDLIALPRDSREYALAYDRVKHPDLPNGIALQPLDLVVRVSANDLPMTTHGFSASVDSAGRLHLSKA